MQTIELDYGALTLDSNIFIGLGLNLEHGFLGKLQQFSTSPVRLVISEVVFQEIRKHLLEITKSSRLKLQGALKSVKAPFGVSGGTISELDDAIFEKKTDAEVVDARLERFVKTTGALVIAASNIDVNRLLSLYFEVDAPFERSGDKKAEFPDAIALLSLEKWAQEQGIQLLVVSKDAGWLKFAEGSMHLDGREDLAETLAYFQPHNAANNIIEALRSQIVTGGSSEILDALGEFISESTNEAEVDVEYSSALHAELEDVEVHYYSHSFASDNSGQPIVDLIGIEANWLSFRLRISIDYEIEANFSMSVWDSTDREYVSIGTSSALAEGSHVSDILLSLTGDFSQGIELTAVGELGIDLKLPGVDVGDVEPNMHDD